MQDQLMSVLNGIPWVFFLKASIVAIILGILKRYYDNWSSYAMFRSNKDLGKNVRVVLNGKEGFITQATWRFIYVRCTDSGNEAIIPITKWTNQKWEIVKNGKESTE